MNSHYLDYQAASPVDERVIESMLPHFRVTGNPSSVHGRGRAAMRAIEKARAQVAGLVGASPEEVIFTSGATEANNLAVQGTAWMMGRKLKKGDHIITSMVEHPSVYETCRFLEKHGFEVDFLPVDEYGRVSPAALEDAVKDSTILVTIGWANPEIGTVQPVHELARIAHDAGAIFHTDATAAVGRIPVNVKNSGIDLLTVSSPELHGPPGVGALFRKKGTAISPLQHGGGQERRMRAGTENVPGIVGFGTAARLMREVMAEENARLYSYSRRLMDTLLKIPYAYLNGHPDERIPNNVNIRFNFIEGEAMLLTLDMENIYASTGSACTSKSLEPSRVLTSCGVKHEEAHGSLQITMGRFTTGEDVEALVKRLPDIVHNIRQMSPLTPDELLDD